MRHLVLFCSDYRLNLPKCPFLIGRVPNSKINNGIKIPSDYYVVTWEDIELFLDDCTKKGRSEATVLKYRRYLEMLYAFLPEDKRIQRGTLALWRENLAQRGYSASSMNVIMSVCDTFLAFMDCRECVAYAHYDVHA